MDSHRCSQLTRARCGDVRPRSNAFPFAPQNVALSIAPWLLLVWGLGLTTAPWRYLLAFGGLPLFVLMWVVVWANLHAFLDHTNRTLRTTPASAPAAEQ